MNEALARHLRHNRGVRIDLYRTVIPPSWTPHPTTARKLGAGASCREYARALRGWRESLRVGCLKRFREF